MSTEDERESEREATEADFLFLFSQAEEEPDESSHVLRSLLMHSELVSPPTADKICNAYDLNIQEYKNPQQFFILLRAFLSPQTANVVFRAFVMVTGGRL